MDSMQKLLLKQALHRMPSATSVLDVGCYRGRFLAHVAINYPSAKLTGIDISERVIQKAQRYTGTRSQFLVASIAQAPFEDESFDLIFACRTLHHWDDKEQGLCEVARILKPGGLFLLGDPFIEGPLLRGWFNRAMEKFDGGRFTHPTELNKMLSRAGLRTIDKTVLPFSGTMLSIYVIAKL